MWNYGSPPNLNAGISMESWLNIELTGQISCLLSSEGTDYLKFSFIGKLRIPTAFY